MGMYTEFHFNVKLIKGIPEEVLNTLNYMLLPMNEQSGLASLPEHPLFQTARWTHMLKMDSYYFDSDTHSTLRLDKSSVNYYLNIRCNLKNYSQEIQKFLAWILPSCGCFGGEFLGFYRYEEMDTPVLIFYPETVQEKPYPLVNEKVIKINTHLFEGYKYE